MKASILKQDLTREFYTDEKCFITELSNSSDDNELSIARARVEPGVTTSSHKLINTAERYYIVSGQGSVEVGDLLAEIVEPGDVVIIPPMVKQRITNTGTDDLIFLALCTPRFVTDAYLEVKQNNAESDI